MTWVFLQKLDSNGEKQWEEGLWNSIKKVCLENGNQEVQAYRFENTWATNYLSWHGGDDLRICDTLIKRISLFNIILGFDRFEDYVGTALNAGLGIGPVAGRDCRQALNSMVSYHLKPIMVPTATTVDRRGWDSALLKAYR